MEEIGKISILALIAVLCSGIIRRGAPEVSVILIIAAGITICAVSVQALEQVMLTVRELASLSRIGDNVLRSVIKVIAVSLVSQITCELCRSCGEGGLASFTEASGTILALYFSLPLAKEVLELMAQLLS